MKKLTVMALIMTMAIGFCACGGNTEAPVETEPTVEEQAVEEPAAEEPEAEEEQIELETVELNYVDPWASEDDTPIWKYYKVTFGFPKDSNWKLESDGNNYVLTDETRNLSGEIKLSQDSDKTWEQNSNYEKEAFSGEDKTWGDFNGFYYAIVDTYNVYINFGNPTIIEDGTPGTNRVNQMKFVLKKKSDDMSLEEVIRIMDEELLANMTYEEVDPEIHAESGAESDEETDAEADAESEE